MKWVCLLVGLGLMCLGGYKLQVGQFDQQKLIKDLTDKVTTLEKAKTDLESDKNALAQEQVEQATKIEEIDTAAGMLLGNHEKRIETIEGELKPH